LNLHARVLPPALLVALLLRPGFAEEPPPPSAVDPIGAAIGASVDGGGMSLSLSAGLPVPVLPMVLSIPEARGPTGPSCKEALGLVPPSDPDAPVAVATPAPPAPTPTPTPTELEAITIEGSGDAITIAGMEVGAAPHQPLEGSRQALAAVQRVMAQAQAGQRVRMSFFGASHTGGDFWTGHIRRVLQDRYGDLGHGFVMPAALYRGYRGSDVNLCRTDGWRADWVGRKDGRDDGLYGFAGMSVSSDDPADWGWVQTTNTNPHGRSVGWFDVYSLGQPDGGTLAVSVDGSEARMIPTAVSEPMLQRHRLLVPEGGHRLSLAPAGDGEVRLFGVSLERDGPGVLVDAMGIRGRQAKTWLDWNEELFGQGVASLDPDLVVLAYGTNEANNTRYDMEEYRADLRAVLQRMRRNLGDDVACVLVGPSDRAKRSRRGRYSVWSRTKPVAQVQREVAPEYGCAFWDWQEAMGGEGSMIAWRRADPPLSSRDLIHFTRAGYERVADQFVAALDAAR